MTENMRKSSSTEQGQQLQNGSPQRRLPPEDFHCTEMAHAVFDRSVGQCYGSFPCTYNRQHGRLYIAKRAVLFYSNLFGYELQLCMPLLDVIGVKLYRSTSIYISMMDGEDFIFKSLSDRERIVNIIHVLLQESQPISLPSSPPENVITSQSLEISEPELLNDEPMLSAPPTLIFTADERKRSQSCPEHMMSNNDFDPTTTTTTNKNNNDVHISERKSSNGEVSTATTNTTCTESILEAWRKVKQTQGSMQNNSKNGASTAVDNLKIACSLNDFFDSFLADDAPHSIPDFQEERIGDSKLQTTKWIADNNTSSESMKRTIQFCHPISTNNFGMGPSSTMATRTQHLSRYGDFGMFMESITVVLGVPAADCFQVVDRWLIEQDDEHHDSISFTVLYETVFTKRTILKRMIESSTQSEIKRWYEAYISMLVKHVQKQAVSPTKIPSKVSTIMEDNVVVKRASLFDYQSVYVMILVVLTLVIMMVQNYYLHLNLHLLRLELMSLREEHAATMQLVRQALLVKSTE